MYNILGRIHFNRFGCPLYNINIKRTGYINSMKAGKVAVLGFIAYNSFRERVARNSQQHSGNKNFDQFHNSNFLVFI